jgi:hypothetical protein
MKKPASGGLFHVLQAAANAGRWGSGEAAAVESLSTFNAILEARMCKAIADGELDSGAHAAGLASVASAVMHSLAVRVRAGDSRRARDELSRAAVDLICGNKASGVSRVPALEFRGPKCTVRGQSR